MATERKKVIVSMYDDDIKMLQDIAEDCGMNKSEVIRQLVFKCYNDEYCRKIITRKSFSEAAKKRTLGKTSHNVHYENQEKNPTSHPVGRGKRCPNESPFHNITPKMQASIDRTIEIAKTKWWEDYE